MAAERLHGYQAIGSGCYLLKVAAGRSHLAAVYGGYLVDLVDQDFLVKSW